ncbi:MAG: glycoside hydrolase/phage tail family protein [Brevundimonas sp.]|uniref:baseplate multidomain protein megatron n=1 Tax=Brevundimonas sp. TaxID=1871086 RepID=UPI001A2AF4E3|nr:glycoside hydrolase/phage tail family protein [Brevundimonas sp.]MBJ7447791.1 glycoside hydrolase/phage tail family protein [Brevundimonas sp.]
MAQVILTSVGQSVGGPIGAFIGSTLGRAIDQRAIASLEPARQRGPRLETLRVQGTAEGAPMACVFGRARVTGQVIWAARFQEGRTTRSASKGGPRTVEYDYALSFAVALCEGEIDGVGRVWADGQPMDMSGVTMRVHRGGAEQVPDPLIEAVEMRQAPSTASRSPSPGGGGEAPAYRGCAYVVFEDLALGPFGNRVPQLSFEVFRRARGSEPRLEDRLEGVCLIPGAGEFVLATDVVMRRDGLTRSTPENLHNGEGRADLLVSIDQLMAQVPNLKRVSLVVGWFGTDVRASHCVVKPGVERRDKTTVPLDWSVAGLGRGSAHLISSAPASTTPEGGGGPPPPEGGGDDSPAYGGTPSDESVRQAVAALKARGMAVTLYPFVFMDCEGYPWRGRVSGRDGANAAADVAAVFGTADGWGLRRMALHYAALAAETGADGLLIGSEMRGLTWTRDAGGGFPAVAQFKTLAAECRAVVGPDVAISYAADWSEYFGRQKGGEVRFHLDPLWADANIDYVGIDWYPPLGDWREGDGGVDAATWGGPDDADYLAAQVAGGEGFDWYYASDADRAAQERTPIIDTAHGEDWVFRPKDLKGWWSNAHHDRPGGVRSATPTAWVPGMKPIRLTEFGCAAVDRGANAPNLFQDPKSSETALPPGSTGARDDRMQRRALEAVLAHYGEPQNNPAATLYAGRMVEGADAWCWDARPYPAFPGRDDVWADAGAWRTGHWLNGRLSGETRDLVAAILKRGGLDEGDFEIGQVAGEVQGYVIDRPMRTRDALEPLLAGLGLTAAERGGKVAVLGEGAVDLMLAEAAMALPDEGGSVRADRRLEARPSAARVRFIDGNADYKTGAVVVRSGGEADGVDLDLPAVCTATTARAAAEWVLAGADGRSLTVALGPVEMMMLEPGDRVEVEGRAGVWRVVRLNQDETPSVVLEPVVDVAAGEDDETPGPGEPGSTVGAPFLRVLELPPLPGSEDDGRALAVVAADPWQAMQVFAGVSADALTARGEARSSATVGVLVEALAPGQPWRWDTVNDVVVRLEGRDPESRSDGAVLAGGNALAVETAAGWEIMQYRAATPEGDGVWRLTGLLRGQQGTESAMQAGAPAGAICVVLDDALVRVACSRGERGSPLIWRAGPLGGPAGGIGVSEVTQTLTGLHERPWRPVHLAVVPDAGGRKVSWRARSRIDGDRWDGEAAGADPLRFRVRVRAGEAVRREAVVEGEGWTYAAGDLATDFPGGIGADATLAVAQWGEGYGWGEEARAGLS